MGNLLLVSVKDDRLMIMVVLGLAAPSSSSADSPRDSPFTPNNINNTINNAAVTSCVDSVSPDASLFSSTGSDFSPHSPGGANSVDAESGTQPCNARTPGLSVTDMANYESKEIQRFRGKSPSAQLDDLKKRRTKLVCQLNKTSVVDDSTTATSDASTSNSARDSVPRESASTSCATTLQPAKTYTTFSTALSQMSQPKPIPQLAPCCKPTNTAKLNVQKPVATAETNQRQTASVIDVSVRVTTPSPHQAFLDTGEGNTNIKATTLNTVLTITVGQTLEAPAARGKEGFSRGGRVGGMSAPQVQVQIQTPAPQPLVRTSLDSIAVARSTASLSTMSHHGNLWKE